MVLVVDQTLGDGVLVPRLCLLAVDPAAPQVDDAFTFNRYRHGRPEIRSVGQLAVQDLLYRAKTSVARSANSCHENPPKYPSR